MIMNQADRMVFYDYSPEEEKEKTLREYGPDKTSLLLSKKAKALFVSGDNHIFEKTNPDGSLTYDVFISSMSSRNNRRYYPGIAKTNVSAEELNQLLEQEHDQRYYG